MCLWVYQLGFIERVFCFFLHFFCPLHTNGYRQTVSCNRGVFFSTQRGGLLFFHVFCPLNRRTACQVVGYLRNVREALTTSFDFVSSETMSAYMVTAYCHDLMGNAAATR